MFLEFKTTLGGAVNSQGCRHYVSTGGDGFRHQKPPTSKFLLLLGFHPLIFEDAGKLKDLMRGGVPPSLTFDAHVNSQFMEGSEVRTYQRGKPYAVL